MGEATDRNMNVILLFKIQRKFRTTMKRLHLPDWRAGSTWMRPAHCGSPWRYDPSVFVTSPDPFRLPVARHLPSPFSLGSCVIRTRRTEPDPIARELNTNF